jgi:dienelactone hydrolase
MHCDEPLILQPRRFQQRVKSWLTALVRAVAPSRAAWRGAAAAVLLVSLIIWLSATIDVVTSASVAIPLLVGAAGILIAVLGSGLVILLLSVARRAPLHFRWACLSGVVLLAGAFSLVPLGVMPLFAVISLTLVMAAVAGGATTVLLTGQWRESGKLCRAATVVCAFLGVGCVVIAVLWLALPGPSRSDMPNAAELVNAPPAPLSMPDPAQKGTYLVRTMTYGAGSDAHRAEFADKAELRTEPVDGSKVLKGWKGFSGWVRTKYWAFDAKRLPLNGRVWYPAGDRSFPLVLIVHGNHLASDFSDPGYEYLGELLASRGYIVVSVDENFLNSMETDVASGLKKENNARGWLLLEHLRVWHEWNGAEGNPFFRKVDTEHIALIGHSRGGEAVAHAAAFNRLPCNPDNAAARFDYGYNIRSIVAIAPADGQYRPAGARTPLENINYFTIQGSHDSDVSSFMGLNQFDRVKFTDGGSWFKSAVYVYAANHGQFNTGWGEFDVGVGIPKRLVNTGALLDAAAQRRIAEGYISAFLDCTLRDVRQYQHLFQDYRSGASWLPKTAYLTQYADSAMKPLCTFDEDIDLSTATVRHGKIASQHLTLWREERLALRDGQNEDRAVALGWDRDHQDGEPSYSMAWPAATFELSEKSVLSFCLADGNEDPVPDDDKTAGEKEKPKSDEPRQPIDLTIEMADVEGHTARLPLSHCSHLQPQIKTPYFKSKLLHSEDLSEPIFQTYLFPLADFRTANADLDLSSTVKIRLVFDRTKSGVVLFDKAAFGQDEDLTRPPPAKSL